MRIEHTIKVDFQRPGVRPVVRIVEGDASTRYIVANLYNGGEPFSVGPGVTGVVKYAKSDGHSGVYDTIDKDKSTEHAAVVFHDNSKQAVVELAPNISMGFGLVALIVQFVSTSGTDILGTFPVDVIVERDPTDGTEAEDYFSYKALDELYAAIDEAKADAAEALAAGLHDITAEYITAKASRPTLTVDAFLLEQEDGLYRINEYDGDAPHTARIVTDRAGAVNMDVVEYRQGDRIERIYIDSTLITTVTMSSGDGAVTINPETLVGDLTTVQSNIAALQAENVALKNKVDAQGYELENLIVAGDGKIYTKSVDSSEAYTKAVPANALPYAALDSIGGKSVVLNQLISPSMHVSSRTVNGITFTFDNGVYHVSGTATADTFISPSAKLYMESGRKYLYRSCPTGGSSNTYYAYLIRAGLDSEIDYGNGAIYTPTTSGDSYIVHAYIKEGVTVDATFAPNAIDLTKMFGAGNEPQTVEQAYAMGVPRTYIPYTAGEIVSADVQSINASGKAPNPIPQAIRTLPGYGWSVGSVYNEVDYAEKKYIQRVTLVKSAELTWRPAGANTFTAVIADMAPAITLPDRKNGFLSAEYPADTQYNVSEMNDKTMLRRDNAIYVRDTALQSIGDVLTADFSINYELAAPIITDISNLLPANFEIIPVEDSGTVTFQQANGTTLPVPATITFPVKMGGDA